MCSPEQSYATPPPRSPTGVTLGLFGRFARGISTQSSFWQQRDGLQRAQGPLCLSLTALFWPLCR